MQNALYVLSFPPRVLPGTAPLPLIFSSPRISDFRILQPRT